MSTHSTDAPEAVYHQLRVPGPRVGLGLTQAPGGCCLVSSWLASWAGPLGLAHRKRSSLIALPGDKASDMEVFHKTTAGGFLERGEMKVQENTGLWELIMVAFQVRVIFTLILGATGFLAMLGTALRTQGGGGFHLGSSVVSL